MTELQITKIPGRKRWALCESNPGMITVLAWFTDDAAADRFYELCRERGISAGLPSQPAVECGYEFPYLTKEPDSDE